MNVTAEQAVVAGGAGFLGSHLTDRLLAENYQVTVIDNLERGKAANLKGCMDRITFIRADLREAHPWMSSLVDSETEVYDLAAKVFGIRYLYQTPWSLMTDNVTITMNNLRRWNQAKKYVYISSSCLYDFEGVPIPHKETDSGWLNSFYGWSKAIGELLCQSLEEERSLNYTILRPFNIYGPRESFQQPHVIPDFIRKACQCKYHGAETFEILGDGSQTRSFTYISDIIEGIRLAAQLGRRTAYNLSCPEETTVMELAETIWSLMEIKPEPVFVEAPEQEVKRRCGCSEKAERELGWTSRVGLREGLKTTLEQMVPQIEADICPR